MTWPKRAKYRSASSEDYSHRYCMLPYIDLLFLPRPQVVIRLPHKPLPRGQSHRVPSTLPVASPYLGLHQTEIRVDEPIYLTGELPCFRHLGYTPRLFYCHILPHLVFRGAALRYPPVTRLVLRRAPLEERHKGCAHYADCANLSPISKRIGLYHYPRV